MSSTLIGKWKYIQHTIVFEWSYRIITLILALFIFFFSIDLMIQTTASMTGSTFRYLIAATHDPSVSFFIGLLLTAIIQSSSTTSSMVVAMVASGTVPFTSGIFIIMGANIGTTITSDLVSLAYINRQQQFRNALASATQHDFFNIFTAIIIFPLEYYYHFLSDTALYITHLINGNINAGYVFHVNGTLFMSPFSNWLISFIGNNWIPLVLGILLLFLSIRLMTYVIYRMLIGDSKDKLSHYIFKSPLKSFSWGFLITGSLQSSSITTSLIVPLASTGRIRLASFLPFIIGANVGTTITALMASIFKPDGAISIAVAHVLFNAIGTLVFLPVRAFRNLIVLAADYFSGFASRYKIAFFIYIILTFFLLPFLLIYLSK